MIKDLERVRPASTFPDSAPCANPVFFRTYSRRGLAGLVGRETWDHVCERTVAGLSTLGDYTTEETALILRMQKTLKALTSGRWLWVGGTDWITRSDNFSGAYNCTSTDVVDWRAFGLMMDLAMMGCGTGAILEPKYINQLPPIRNYLTVTMTGAIGTTPAADRAEQTQTTFRGQQVHIKVGDSRKGWVDSYQKLLECSSDEQFNGAVELLVDLSDVRPSGETLKGFGGMANPVKLPDLYNRCVNILNKAIGRQLNSIECCLLIDEAASCIVAGNIRRSAGMRQFNSEDTLAATAKDNLWVQDAQGNWRVDAERDSLRMANHTRVYHHKPTLQACVDAVRKQFYSGEGAIQWAGEAIARGSRDLITDDVSKHDFTEAYSQGNGKEWLQEHHPDLDDKELVDRLGRYGLNPCGEIIGANFHCNLSEIHLNQIDPNNYQEQDDAFRAGALAVSALLNHQFKEIRYQYSRSKDPIVGVSFTGLFDFFVQAFGLPWLKWWEQGRPATPEGVQFKLREQAYLTRWRDAVHDAVWDYCDRHGLRRPNRCTTVQPAGTKSLLSGAAPGWHPPKAQRYIRRITFAKNDPVALACLDFGYSIVPSQSDKDENGRLLDDPFDSRCTEWLVEIPVEVPWANIPGADQVVIENFSAVAQMDFYMQVQRYYTTHNTSATIELREDEIEALGARIYEAIQQDEGYISAALLARFDAPFPRLPFEKIDRTTFEKLHRAVLIRRQTDDFAEAVLRYDMGFLTTEGPAGCDAMGCLLPEKKG